MSWGGEGKSAGRAGISGSSSTLNVNLKIKHMKHMF